jgi:hypothetical protein
VNSVLSELKEDGDKLSEVESPVKDVISRVDEEEEINVVETSEAEGPVNNVLSKIEEDEEGEKANDVVKISEEDCWVEDRLSVAADEEENDVVAILGEYSSVTDVLSRVEEE